jgi:DNA-binding CsgD family transcriptional regulator
MGNRKIDNREIVVRLFKQNKTPYEIQLITDLGIKEIYHHIRTNEEMKARHKQKLREQANLPLYEVS